MPKMTGTGNDPRSCAPRAVALPVIMATGNLPTYEFVRKPWLKPDIILEKPLSNDDLLAAGGKKSWVRGMKSSTVHNH